MPVLSLPLPRFGVLEHLPLRVPFPFMRIASILPQSINEPFKASLLALFKLAWSAKLQIPVLITVVFMACDIRLQLEINIIWEANNRPPHGNRIGVDRAGNRHAQQRRASGGGEDMRRTALVAAAVYQQQRRRLIQEIRAQQTRQRTEGSRRRSLTSALPPAAPLAVEEDSDLDNSRDSDTSDSDTICSQRSTTSEAADMEAIFAGDDDTEDPEDNEPARKKKMKKRRSRPSSREPDDDDNEDDEDTTTDDEGGDDDDDDDNYGGGGGENGGSGSSHFGGGGGGRYRDDSYDHDSDADDNSNDESGAYSSPLVVEVEIRHRSLFSKSNFQMNSRTLRIPLPVVRCNMDKSQYFSQYLKTGFPNVYRKFENDFAFMSPFYYL